MESYSEPDALHGKSSGNSELLYVHESMHCCIYKNEKMFYERKARERKLASCAITTVSDDSLPVVLIEILQI